MTRFKELRRIETAMDNEDMAELKWAVKYCKMRLCTATMKYHEKHWNKMLKKIQNILEKANKGR